MKTSKVFRLAKANLRTDFNGKKELYICHAIESIDVLRQDKRNAKRVVQYLLNGHISLESWLYHKHSISVDFSKRKDVAKIQTTRHAWLDHLIEHYEAQGD